MEALRLYWDILGIEVVKERSSSGVLESLVNWASKIKDE